MDLFEHEQKIYDDAKKRIEEIGGGGAPVSFDEYAALVKEFGRFLKQSRRATRMADRTTADLYESNLDLTDKVHYDALTGIYNRRYMEENLNRVIRSLSRSGGCHLSVFMIDIDYFKQYNDTYMHSAGDACLKRVAETIASCLARADDFVARYGGEEFAAILPNTDEAGARVVADKMLGKVRANCDVTISIGITTNIVEYKQSGTDYINRADGALYMSKQSGRDRYTFINFEEARG